jgi:hypothetical protein
VRRQHDIGEMTPNHRFFLRLEALLLWQAHAALLIHD